MSQRKIAEEAGVSIMTVSRVLRGKADVAEETRRRVLAVAAKYHYRPNLLVRGIQTGRTKSIGVLLPHEMYSWRIFAGIERALLAADYVPIFLSSDLLSKEDKPAVDCLAQIHRFIDRRADGVLLKAGHCGSCRQGLEVLRARKIPFVCLEERSPEEADCFVGYDGQAAGNTAATHLLELGHTRLCVITPPDSAPFQPLAAAFQAACHLATGHMPPSLPIDAEDSATLKALQACLTEPEAPTALFLLQEALAVPVYDLLKKMDRAVPGAVSVLGYGDGKLAPYIEPALSIVGLLPEVLGLTAARLLLTLLHEKSGAPEKRTQLVEPVLFRCESTGAIQS